MDNCNVMHGKKEGVEARIRQLNKNLLDVSVITIHMVNNEIKKKIVPVKKFSKFQT